MKKLKVLMILLLFVACVFAAELNKEKRLETFTTKYQGRVDVSWDNKINSPKFVIGDNIKLKSANINETNIEKVAGDFIRESKAFLFVNFSG